MRGALRKKLLEIEKLGGRVFEIQVPDKNTAKPYVVIKQGNDIASEEWIGYRRIYEIYPYLTRTSFRELDKLVKEIIEKIDRKIIRDDETGEAFTCLLENVGADFVDDDWNAITKPITFSVFALRYISEEESRDDWLEILKNWTAQNYNNLSIYLGVLPTGYQKPCIMWRNGRSVIERVGALMIKEEREIRGHVITQNVQEEEGICRDIVNKLNQAIKIGGSNGYISVNEANFDIGRDVFREGQIILRASRISLERRENDKFSKVKTGGAIK